MNFGFWAPASLLTHTSLSCVLCSSSKFRWCTRHHTLLGHMEEVSLLHLTLENGLGRDMHIKGQTLSPSLS